MKKSIIFGLGAAMALAFTACDNYEEPNPRPQTNAQQSVLLTDDVTVTSDLTEVPYDLKALNDEGQNITVATIAVPDLAKNYILAVDLQISANGFARTAEVPATVTAGEDGNYVVSVNPDDLQGVYYANISKGPKQKAIETRFLLKTYTGNDKNHQEAYVGGPDHWYGPYTLTVQPFPSELVIEESYYLVGTLCDWQVAQAVKFNHSDENQYDDPVFTLKFDVSAELAEAGWWWKVLPASVYATGNWGEGPNTAFGPAENGDEAAQGVLVGTDPQAGCWKQMGQWLMTINMEEGTYEISSAVDVLYTPGGANGWNQAASQQLFTDDYANYRGFAMVDGEFKFTSAPDWNHTNYGSTGEEGKLTTDGGAGNISLNPAGLYYLTANTASLTYSAYLVESIGVVGDATPGAWDNSTALASEDGLVWKGDIQFKGGEFKFRCNNAWDVNLGGQLQNLSFGGGNIASPGEGTYTVTLDLSQLPYAASIVKK